MLSDEFQSEMGYTVRLQEQTSGHYVIWCGGRRITKRNGEVLVYRGVERATSRFKTEVAKVQNWERQLKEKGVWHQVYLCAGGCGLEMRDGRVDQASPFNVRCIQCGPFPAVAA